MSITRASPDSRRSGLKRALLLVTATGFLANAVFRLADPLGWYGAVEGVPDTGPFNPHFVRGIGAAAPGGFWRFGFFLPMSR